MWTSQPQFLDNEDDDGDVVVMRQLAFNKKLLCRMFPLSFMKHRTAKIIHQKSFYSEIKFVQMNVGAVTVGEVRGVLTNI